MRFISSYQLAVSSFADIVVIASVTALVAVVLGVMLLALVFIIRSSGRHKRRSYMHTLMIDTKQNQVQ